MKNLTNESEDDSTDKSKLEDTIQIDEGMDGPSESGSDRTRIPRRTVPKKRRGIKEIRK